MNIHRPLRRALSRQVILGYARPPPRCRQSAIGPMSFRPGRMIALQRTRANARSIATLSVHPGSRGLGTFTRHLESAAIEASGTRMFTTRRCVCSACPASRLVTKSHAPSGSRAGCGRMRLTRSACAPGRRHGPANARHLLTKDIDTSERIWHPLNDPARIRHFRDVGRYRPAARPPSLISRANRLGSPRFVPGRRRDTWPPHAAQSSGRSPGHCRYSRPASGPAPVMASRPCPARASENVADCSSFQGPGPVQRSASSWHAKGIQHH